ncbi:MAG: cobalamin-independent methionine synthase II family protein [Chloroflexi bacterium]|nr:cobalamin-independent methionine synthase II family protein [Chloroflexota bacterium]
MPSGVERILTTHTGSLPRPPDLLGMIQARETGQPYDAEALSVAVRRSVAAAVRAQADAGIDIVNDGELSKAGFSDYIKDRVSGLEGVDPSPQAPSEVDFPEFAEWWRTAGFMGNVTFPRPVCVGPMAWTHPETVEADVANFRDALADVDVAGAFMTASSPGILDLRIANQHYPTEEEYVYALAEMMKVEYRAIADAGFVLQVDAPEMAMGRNWARFRDGSLEDFRRAMGLWAEALNHALEGIPEEQVRYHICWGNSEGPHVRDVPLRDIVDIVLQVRAGAYSVEASNPRHAHEWRVWEDVKLPEGKTLIPGVIDSTTNFVEHPDLVRDRILSYASIVGRDSVMASTDCGFGTFAGRSRVHPTVVWAKLRAMAEGARLASEALWG